MMPIRAYAPATIGNFIAGFDVLGAALAPLDGSLWGDVVEAHSLGKDPSLSSRLTVKGPFASDMPKDPKKNLVWRTLQLFVRLLRRYEIHPRPVALTLYKNLPVCSGLGSSASSAAATLVAVNAFFRQPLDLPTLLGLAGQAEGLVSGVHFDNVAPALLGGLQLVQPHALHQQPTVRCAERFHVLTQRLPFPKQLLLVVVHPALSVPTKKARAILPKQIPLSLATQFGANLGSFVYALHQQDLESLACSLKDLLAEPVRKKLVKGFSTVQQAALEHGALGCSLSGSGPSMVAVVDSEAKARRVSRAMRAQFAQHRINSKATICRLDDLGARLV